MSKQGKGDCFQVAGTLMMDGRFLKEHPDAVCVHASVQGQGPLAGRRLVHGWVEAGGLAIDRSNGKNLAIPAGLYRAIGNATMIYTYTPEQARRLMVKTGIFGPWEQELQDHE